MQLQLMHFAVAGSAGSGLSGAQEWGYVYAVFILVHAVFILDDDSGAPSSRHIDVQLHVTAGGCCTAGPE